MSAEVINLEDHRPHFSVHDPVDNKQHVVPVSLVVAIIDGEIEAENCDQSMIRALLRELLAVIADE
jgi:tellurite resistance protein